MKDLALGRVDLETLSMNASDCERVGLFRPGGYLFTAQFLPGILDANLCKNKQKQTNRTKLWLPLIKLGQMRVMGH